MAKYDIVKTFTVWDEDDLVATVTFKTIGGEPMVSIVPAKTYISVDALPTLIEALSHKARHYEVVVTAPRNMGTIGLIKLVRRLHGHTLKDAKEFVEKTPLPFVISTTSSPEEANEVCRQIMVDGEAEATVRAVP